MKCTIEVTSDSSKWPDPGGLNRQNGSPDTHQITQALDIGYSVDSVEYRQHHRIPELQLVLLRNFALLVQFVDEQLAGLKARDPGIGYPLDMSLAQFALWIKRRSNSCCSKIHKTTDCTHKCRSHDWGLNQVDSVPARNI
jgi:hypothetical protein